jgi:hypothetical protein
VALQRLRFRLRNLAQASLEKSTLTVVRYQRQRWLVTLRGFRFQSNAARQIRRSR